MKPRFDSRLAALMVVAGSLVTTGVWSDAWGQSQRPRGEEPVPDDTGTCQVELGAIEGTTEASRVGSTLVCVRRDAVIDDAGHTLSDKLLKVVLEKNALGFEERVGKGLKQDRLFMTTVGDAEKTGMLRGDRKWEAYYTYDPGIFYAPRRVTQNFAAYSDTEGPFHEVAEEDGKLVDLINLGEFTAKSEISKQEEWKPSFPFSGGAEYSGTKVILTYRPFVTRIPPGKEPGKAFKLHSEVKEFEFIISSKVDENTWKESYWISCSRQVPSEGFHCSQSSRFSPTGTSNDCQIATTPDRDADGDEGGEKLRKCGQDDGWDKVSAELRDSFDESTSPKVDFAQPGNLLGSDAYNGGLTPITYPRSGHFVVTSRGNASEVAQKIMFALNYGRAIFPTQTIDAVYEEGR